MIAAKIIQNRKTTGRGKTLAEIAHLLTFGIDRLCMSFLNRNKLILVFDAFWMLLLVVVHFLYCSFLGADLFELAGGVHHSSNGWTSYGGIDFAWTVLSWLPGGILFSYINSWGACLIIVGSCAAAFSLSLHFQMGIPNLLWRWLLPIACWLIWIPVPVEWTWAYWSMVRY